MNGERNVATDCLITVISGANNGQLVLTISADPLVAAAVRLDGGRFVLGAQNTPTLLPRSRVERKCEAAALRKKSEMPEVSQSSESSVRVFSQTSPTEKLRLTSGAIHVLVRVCQRGAKRQPSFFICSHFTKPDLMNLHYMYMY